MVDSGLLFYEKEEEYIHNYGNIFLGSFNDDYDDYEIEEDEE